MSDVTSAALHAALVVALRDADAAGRGLPPALEGLVRSYARALRLDGVAVERMIVDVKAMVRAETGNHELVFMPRIVGWAVAGYFAGSAPPERDP